MSDTVVVMNDGKFSRSAPLLIFTMNRRTVSWQALLVSRTLLKVL